MVIHGKSPLTPPADSFLIRSQHTELSMRQEKRVKEQINEIDISKHRKEERNPLIGRHFF